MPTYSRSFGTLTCAPMCALAALALLALTAPVPAVAQTVVVGSDILADDVWGDDETEVILPYPIFVSGGAKLTILPGTIIRGEPRTGPLVNDFQGALVITETGEIDADGTANAPIIFTTAAVDNDMNQVPDDVDNNGYPDPWSPGDFFLDADPFDGTPPDDGLWGGLYILGSAPAPAAECAGFENGIVQLFNLQFLPPEYSTFGGPDPNDSSGTLRKVRVRGADPATECCEGVITGDGITLAGVGAGTIFEQNDFISQCWSGFADLHAHPMNHLGFGHDESPLACGFPQGIFHGRPGGALNLADRDAGMDVDLAKCAPEVHTECPTLSFEQRITRQTMMRVIEARYPNHGPSGAPQFLDWPHAQSVTHQQMHVKWLRQAYEAGQRVMIASVTDSEVLEKWYNYLAPGPFCEIFEPDSAFLLDSAIEQILAIQALAAANSSWLHIADTPADAADAAFPLSGPGKLVLILGLEMDALPIADTLDLVDNFGVRSVIPIHLVNNSVGGTAVYNSVFNTLNFWQEGSYFEVVNDPMLSFTLDPEQRLNAYQPLPLPGRNCAVAPDLEANHNPSYVRASHTCAGDGPGGERNARGVSDFDALFALMQRGVLLDTTHMGFTSKEETIQFAELMANISPIAGYPLIDSHTSLRDETQLPDPAEPAVSERDLTWDHARRIQDLGGVVGFGTVGDPPQEGIVAGRGQAAFNSDSPNEILIRLTGEGHEWIAYNDTTDEQRTTDFIHRLDVRIATGGDNLNGGSSARLLIHVGANIHTFALKDPGPEWTNDSVNLVTVTQEIGGTPLSTLGIQLADIDQIGVLMIGGSDNWDIRRLDVTYVGEDSSSGSPSGGMVVERFGFPYVRLTGSVPEVLTPPVDWRPRNLADAEVIIDALHIEWETQKSGLLDPELYMILNLHDGSTIKRKMGIWSGVMGDDPDDGGLTTGTWDLATGSPGTGVRYGDIASLMAYGAGRNTFTSYDVEVRRVDIRFDGCADPPLCSVLVTNAVLIDGSDPTARGEEPFLIRADRPTANLWVGLPPPAWFDRASTLATPLLHLKAEIDTGDDGLEIGNRFELELLLRDGARHTIEIIEADAVGLEAHNKQQIIKPAPNETMTVGDIVAYTFIAPDLDPDNLDVQRLDLFRLGDPMAKWLAQYKEASWVISGNPADPPWARTYEPGWLAIGSDFNGLSPQMPYVDRAEIDVGTPLDLPAPYTGASVAGDTTLARTFTFDEDGLAHYGMLKDFADEVNRRDPVAGESLYRTATRTLQTWRRATQVGATIGDVAPAMSTVGACGDPACSDGIDNDGDGWTDFPSDPNCDDLNDVSEVPEPGVALGLLAGVAALRALRGRRRAVRVRRVPHHSRGTLPGSKPTALAGN